MGKEAGEPILPQKDGKLWSSGAESHPSVWIPVFVWHLWCLSGCAHTSTSTCLHLICCHTMLVYVHVSPVMHGVQAGRVSPETRGLRCCLYPGDVQQILCSRCHTAVSIWLVNANKFLLSHAALSYNMLCNYAWRASRTAQCTSVQLISYSIQITVVCKQGHTMWVENRGTWLEPVMTVSVCIQVSRSAAPSCSRCALALPL